MKIETLDDIGWILIDARIWGKTYERKFISQTALSLEAKKNGYALEQEQISDYECGKTSPSIKTLLKIAKLLEAELHISFESPETK